MVDKFLNLIGLEAIELDEEQNQCETENQGETEMENQAEVKDQTEYKVNDNNMGGRKMKIDKKKIKIVGAALSLVLVLMVGINIVNSPRGTYYEIGNPTKFVKISGNTITESYTGDTLDYVKNDNFIDVMYEGMTVKTFMLDEFQGYDCLFEVGDDVPDYCKSKEGAEKIQKALDDAEKAKVESEMKIVEDAQRKLVKEFDGTNWMIGSSRDLYDDYDGSLSMEDGNITIDFKEILSEYDEDKVPSTLVLKGKYEYNSEGAENAEELENRSYDVKIIPESLVINNKERSLEDISASISLCENTNDDANEGEYLKRTFYLNLNIPLYPDAEQFFYGDIGGEFIKL